MKNNRISGFQWAMTIFVFFVVTMALFVILRDFQAAIGVKRFVFDITDLSPFIAAIICLLVFKHKKEQMASLKFTFSLKVIERLLLALIIPLFIFIIGMFCFNTFADSFILLQASDLSVSIFAILIGHLIMAFVVEFGFRSYLQHIVETKMNTLFASIVVGIIYSIFNANTTYGLEFAGYHFLYTFAFSMIVGELIRATNGRTIYIATLFHAAMSFGLVFLFSEEIGDLFSMKVIALATTAVGLIYIILSLIIRAIFYKKTNQSLDEVEPNNYLDHVSDDNDNDYTETKHDNSRISDNYDRHKDTLDAQHQDNKHDVQDHGHGSESTEHLKEHTSYKQDRRSSVVSDLQDEIKQTEEHSPNNKY
ncbi:CPBP family intramembrane metalloprotease [Bacillaceae bacterium HSR45]|nr:CPBP family intramembrane metalloprotease [Bacillaceae bacterium HSR45]